MVVRHVHVTLLTSDKTVAATSHLSSFFHFSPLRAIYHRFEMEKPRTNSFPLVSLAIPRVFDREWLRCLHIGDLPCEHLAFLYELFGGFFLPSAQLLLSYFATALLRHHGEHYNYCRSSCSGSYYC